MVSRSLRSKECFVALDWESIGSFPGIQVIIQSPMSQNSFYCRGCVYDSNTWGSSANEAPFRVVSAQFQSWRTRKKGLLSKSLGASGFSFCSTISSPLTGLWFSHSFITAPFGDGLCLPGYNAACHSRIASLLLKQCSSKLQLAS